MMPRILSLVLLRLAGGAALLVLLALGLALPARQVLLPSWPDPVDEVLAEAGPGGIERRFLPPGSAVGSGSMVVARSRPITLWRLETGPGEYSHAWLAGVRDGNRQLLPSLPAWLEPERLDGPLPESVNLVLITAARETREVEGDSIVRMYRPNDLSLVQRTVLWRDRLDERWKWPLKATGDARMTPLSR